MPTDSKTSCELNIFIKMHAHSAFAINVVCSVYKFKMIYISVFMVNHFVNTMVSNFIYGRIIKAIIDLITSKDDVLLHGNFVNKIGESQCNLIWVFVVFEIGIKHFRYCRYLFRSFISFVD